VPTNDPQFWIVSGLAVVGLVILLRSMGVFRRGKRGKRVELTVGGKPPK